MSMSPSLPIMEQVGKNRLASRKAIAMYLQQATFMTLFFDHATHLN